MFLAIMVGFVSTAMVLGDNQYQPSPTSYYSSNSQKPIASSYYDPEPVATYSSENGPLGESTYSTETDSPASSIDFSLIVIPLLIVVGISLLFPNITNVTTRKRRYAGGKNKHTQQKHKHTHSTVQTKPKLPCTKEKNSLSSHFSH